MDQRLGLRGHVTGTCAGMNRARPRQLHLHNDGRYLRFWYQVFTWVSVRFSLAASSMRSCTLRYFCLSKFVSRVCSWWSVKAVRAFLCFLCCDPPAASLEPPFPRASSAKQGFQVVKKDLFSKQYMYLPTTSSPSRLRLSHVSSLGSASLTEAGGESVPELEKGRNPDGYNLRLEAMAMAAAAIAGKKGAV